MVLHISLFIYTMDVIVNIEEIDIPEIDDLPDTLVTVDSVTELDIQDIHDKCLAS